MNTAARKYRRQVRRSLTCSVGQKHKMMCDLSRTVKIFLEDYPDASYNDFLQAFGHPSDMAADMLQDVSRQEINRTIQRDRRVRCGLVAALILVSVTACAAARFFYWQRENNPHEIQTVIYEQTAQIPQQTQNGLQYGLSYQLDENGTILTAFDAEGNEIPVDENGMPIGEAQ